MQTIDGAAGVVSPLVSGVRGAEHNQGGDVRPAEIEQPLAGQAAEPIRAPRHSIPPPPAAPAQATSSRSAVGVSVTLPAELVRRETELALKRAAQRIATGRRLDVPLDEAEFVDRSVCRELGDGSVAVTVEV